MKQVLLIALLCLLFTSAVWTQYVENYEQDVFDNENDLFENDDEEMVMNNGCQVEQQNMATYTKYKQETETYVAQLEQQFRENCYTSTQSEGDFSFRQTDDCINYRNVLNQWKAKLQETERNIQITTNNLQTLQC